MDVFEDAGPFGVVSVQVIFISRQTHLSKQTQRSNHIAKTESVWVFARCTQICRDLCPVTVELNCRGLCELRDIIFHIMCVPNFIQNKQTRKVYGCNPSCIECVGVFVKPEWSRHLFLLPGRHGFTFKPGDAKLVSMRLCDEWITY